ncbi:MAG: hypothetical protein RL729_701, partial [Actinomycetota bacterium]
MAHAVGGALRVRAYRAHCGALRSADAVACSAFSCGTGRLAPEHAARGIARTPIQE